MSRSRKTLVDKTSPGESAQERLPRQATPTTRPDRRASGLGGRRGHDQRLRNLGVTRTRLWTRPVRTSLRAARRHAMSLAVLLLAGVLLSFDLGSRGLWGKEAASWTAARPSLRTLLDLGSDDGAVGPLYAVVLKGWLSLFGNSEAAIRSLSVVLAVATAAVVSALGFRLRSRAVGVLAAGIFVLNGPVQKYGQNGSATLLLTFGTSLASLAFVRELQPSAQRANRWWMGLRISLSTLLAFVHPLGVIVAICHFLATLVLPAEERRWPSRVWTLIVPLVASLPAWFAALRSDDSLGFAADELAVLLAPAVALIVASGLIRCAEQARPRRNGVSVTNLRWITASAAVTVAVALWTVSSTWRWHRCAQCDGWRAAAQFVFDGGAVGDGALFTDVSVQLFFAYYAQRFGIGPEGPPVSAFPSNDWDAGQLHHTDDVAFSLEQANVVAQRHTRLWVVVEKSEGKEPPESVSDLLRHNPLINQRVFNEAGTIYLVQTGVRASPR